MPLSDRLLAFKALCSDASPGPWEDLQCNAISSDQTYYAVQGPDGKTLFDSANSENMELHEEHDDDGKGGVTYWDEIGRRNLEFAAAARTEVPFLFEEIERLRERADAFDWVLSKIRNVWKGYKPPTDGRSDIHDVMGSMHVLESHAHGYETYIAAFKCDDKQGEIARLTVEINQLRTRPHAPAVVLAAGNVQGTDHGNETR